MKKMSLLFSVFLVSMLFNINSVAAKQSLDQIVAVVNDDVITESEFNHSFHIAKVTMSHMGGALPPDAVLKKKVLDQLITKKLQLQLAKQAGVIATETELDAAVQKVASQNNMTSATFYERIAQEGMSKSDYREEMRDQITLHKLQQQEVVNHVSISQDEITSFKKSKLWQSNSAKEYKLEDILLPLSDAPSPDDIIKARKQAEAVVAKLNKGASFKDVAQSESGDTRALQGGDLGWRKLPEVPTAFAEHIVRMQANEIAGPIQTPNGFHVIRLSAVRDTEGPKQAPDSKQIENYLMQRKFDEAVQNWVSKIRSTAFIKVTEQS